MPFADSMSRMDFEPALLSHQRQVFLAPHAAVVTEYLRDLQDLVGRQRPVRDHATVPAERTPDNPLGIYTLGTYTLAPDRIRRKTEEEIEAERLVAENERSARLRFVYQAIGLAVTAHKDGTLLLRWSLRERALPGVTGPESPVLGRIFAPDGQR